MAEDRSRILELLDEIRREEAELSLDTRDGPPAIPEPKAPDDEIDPRENEARYLRERAEELLDALSPEERRVEEESEEALRPRAGPGGDGLAVMVGHSRKSIGATAISPPFPPELGAEEYHWNSELALQIKALADQNGIRCKVFYRDGLDIPGAYELVKEWNPRATIELHFNCDGPNTQGTETWYGDDVSLPWAARLQARMVRLYGRKGRADRGTKDARAIPPHRALTSTTQTQPSALIEPFFGSNLDDCQMTVDKKPGLARAVVEAFADLVGMTLPAGAGAGTAIVPRPQPVPTQVRPSATTAPASPETPLRGLPESALFARLRHLYLKSDSASIVSNLKIVTLAQWALESSWGTSGLATEHFNFGGMKGIAEINHLLDIATIVPYQAHDGWDRYLRFGSLENFIEGYWRFLERSPYRGWRERAADECAFISFIASKWAPVDRNYPSKVLDLAQRIRRALAEATEEVGATGTGAAGEGGASSARPSEASFDLDVIPADASDFRRLVNVAVSPSFEHPALRGVLLAQCAIESNWGRSELARAHCNFAGIEWTELLKAIAVPVEYRRSDGVTGTYCRFLDHASFMKGYFTRLDGDPRFAGWKAKAGDRKAFLDHIAPNWRPSDPNYSQNVLNVLQRLLRPAAPGGAAAGTGPAATPEGGPMIPAGQVPDGYVIRIRRQRVERRVGTGTRTVGTYEVFFRGQKIPALEGMSLETHGPGDNTPTGRSLQRRVEAKAYPLGTHSSQGAPPKYTTFGYTANTAAFAMSRPAIRLDGTNARAGVLMHPGGGFLSSVGCINLSSPLVDASKNIDYADSRSRVIAIVEDMKARLGAAFPSRNWMTIPNAWMVIEGEPGQERAGPAAPDPIVSILEAIGRGGEEAQAAIRSADAATLYDVAAAAMDGSVFPDIASAARLRALSNAGVDLKSQRGAHGETLWFAWLDGVSAAAELAMVEARTRAEGELDAVSALLADSGVDVNDAAGGHTPLVLAAIADQTSAMTALIARGAQIDAHDRLGLTPLIAAAFFGSANAVAELVARGADRGELMQGPASTDPEAEIDAELPKVGSNAFSAAEQGRAMVLFAEERDAAFDRIVDRLTRP